MTSAIIFTLPLVVAAVSFHLKRDAAGNRSALVSLVAAYVVVTMLLAGCLVRVRSDLEVMMFRSMPMAVWGNPASSDAAWSGMQEWRAANQLSVQIRQSFEGPVPHLSLPNAIYVVIFATSHGITLMMLALAGGALGRAHGIKVLARAFMIGGLYVVLLQVLPRIEAGLPFPYRLIAFDLDQVVMLAALWRLANHAAMPGLKPRPTP
jgi:hypothetical protein